MNKDWVDKNKEFQKLISKEATYKEAVEKLIILRGELFGQIADMVDNYPAEAFSMMPFAGKEGYHSKTMAYSIWHIFRIEDIVAHELIAGDEQVLFSGNYVEKIFLGEGEMLEASKAFLSREKGSMITTGNELVDEQIKIFSEAMNVKELFLYAKAVKESTEEILRGLAYKDLKRKFTEDYKEKIARTGCVSEDENAIWLIDYWCGKDVKGLMKMPFSRHWIMHIEAMLRIEKKLCKLV